jgi:hypothetical protein
MQAALHVIAMVRTAAKLLAAALVIDALAAAWIITGNDDRLLVWLLLANAIAIPALIIAVIRKKPASQKHSGRASFAEHQKLHGSLHQTRKGETVKSGGERILADYFYRNKIRYEYEKAAIGDSGRMISRPDFYLPDYDVYVEYWGMADTEDSKERKEYARSMELKMARYRENGIKFISIYPREIDSIDSVFQKKLKDAL